MCSVIRPFEAYRFLQSVRICLVPWYSLEDSGGLSSPIKFPSSQQSQQRDYTKIGLEIARWSIIQYRLSS